MKNDHMYGIRLSHIFEIPSISNEKSSTSNEKPSICIGNLVFRSKNPVFQIKNFEILGFLHIEFEILGNSTEIPNIQKRCEILGFKGTLCVSSDIGFRR